MIAAFLWLLLGLCLTVIAVTLACLSGGTTREASHLHDGAQMRQQKADEWEQLGERIDLAAERFRREQAAEQRARDIHPTARQFDRGHDGTA